MTDPATAPLDHTDHEILDRLAAAHARLDPPPADLDARVQFAISLPDLDAEVAHLAGLVATTARGSERTRTITFDAESRTVMITIADQPDGSVRLDGWLAPAAPLRVELRLPEPEPARTVTADQAGRFVFDRVPHGLAQLLVHPPEPGGGMVVTPSLAL